MMPSQMMPSTHLPRGLVLNGTVGAGKTTVAEAIGDLLAERRTPHAVLDLDWLRRCWPAPGDDPFNTGLCLRNLAAVAANARQAGASLLVIAGVVETRGERARLEQSAGFPLTVCRLLVDAEVARRRLTERHRLDPDSRDWHLNRVAELDRILAAAGVDDAVVTVGTNTPRQVASGVLAAVGW